MALTTTQAREGSRGAVRAGAAVIMLIGLWGLVLPLTFDSMTDGSLRYYRAPMAWMEFVVLPLLLVAMSSRAARLAHHIVSALAWGAAAGWFALVSVWGLYLLVDSWLATDSDSSTVALDWPATLTVLAAALALVAASARLGRPPSQPGPGRPNRTATGH
jgi:hypothetical protein